MATKKVSAQTAVPPTELPEPDPTLSLDANDSTYEVAEHEEQFPPSGNQVLQTLGQPGDGSPAPKAASSTTSSES